MSFKSGDIVWANLGISYGWWPAEIASGHKSNEDKKENVTSQANCSQASDESVISVRFFDDEKFENYRLRDASLVKPYSCPEKLDLVASGMASLDESYESNGQKVNCGNGTKQSQFIKDVEMAEVMTDNDPRVAEILSNFYLDKVENTAEKPKPKKRRRKRY